MKMRLNDTDISRLITACKLYQERTGSEYMWEQYDDLINKLNAYQDNYSACLLYTSPSPRDATLSRMPSSA